MTICVYLVGGAVRDSLLGLTVTDRDYVVVGATEQEMLDMGYQRVGKNFPVFLHPETKEEYALARTEKKVTSGHTGFICHASPEVTLEEDLLRRDITINAIAQSTSGQIIDPLGGESDLANKLLKHASDAFTEDPLRILRVARFYSKFHRLGFKVHPKTTSLIMRMTQEGKLTELSAERINSELEKAFDTEDPAVFFDYLYEVGANKFLWPEITEKDVNSLRKLRFSKISSLKIETYFSGLTMNMRSASLNTFCRRLKCSTLRTETSTLVASFLTQWALVNELDAKQIISLLQQTDAFRKRDRFNYFNRICSNLTKRNDLSKKWDYF